VLVFIGALKGYGYAQLHLALARAQREFSTSQFMRAEFWAGRALHVDEKNIEATRLMAEIYEAQDKPSALTWRIKVAQLEPENTGDIMAWAKCALRFGQPDMAAGALKSLPQDFKDRNAGYYELMAGCALAAHDNRLAEAWFTRAADLGGDNPLHKVNLAAFRLTNSPSPDIRAEAVRDLEGALPDPHVSLFAVRALLVDAIRSGDHARSQRFAEKLRSLPEHNFNDDLSCLEAAIAGPAFQPALVEIEHRAESDARLATEMGDWLNSHGMAAGTLRWFGRLPGPVAANVRVQMTEADAYLATGDWKGLEAFLAKCQWNTGEFLRRAMLIRCKRELSQPWEQEWKQLVVEVDANPPDSLLLAQLVTGWNWRDETIALLWDAASRPQTESQALQYLWDIYSRANDTGKMWRVARAQIDIDPSNPAKKNNDAFLSLLLYGASERSEHLAQEASAANPKVPEWAATYAYALHLEGRESEAKKVMDNLPPVALGRPGIALYYAIILAANGDQDKARETLAKLNSSGMLPEEKKLAADLAQKLNVASR